MLRLCTVFNVLAGVIAIIFSLGLSFLAIGFAGGLSISVFLQVLLVCGPLGLAVILYVASGIELGKSLPAVTGRVISLQGIAWVLCLTHCFIWFVFLQGNFGVGGLERQPGEPFDEEVVMFVFIPTAALLLAAIQLTYLWRKRKQQVNADGI